MEIPMAKFINDEAELERIHDKLCDDLDELDKYLDMILYLHKIEYLNEDALEDFIDYTSNKKNLIEIEQRIRHRKYLEDFLKDINNRNAKRKFKELKNDPIVNDILETSGQTLLEKILRRKIRISNIIHEGINFNYISIDGPSAILGDEYQSDIENDIVIININSGKEIDIPVSMDRTKKIFSDNMEKINYPTKERIDYNNQEWDNLLQSCRLLKKEGI